MMKSIYFNKLLLLTLFIVMFITSFSNAADNYRMIFKPNNNLKYRALLYAKPDGKSTEIMDYFIRDASEKSTLLVSYVDNQFGTMNAHYLLYTEKGSCCNPFTLYTRINPITIEIDNVIRLNGMFVSNIKDELSSSCILGFDIFKLQADSKTKGNQPVVFPIYFSDKEISHGGIWQNVFYSGNKSISIEYCLKDVSGDIAQIEGLSSSGFLIEVEFDIKNGYIISLKMYTIEYGAKTKLFKSYELIN